MTSFPFPVTKYFVYECYLHGLCFLLLCSISPVLHLSCVPSLQCPLSGHCSCMAWPEARVLEVTFPLAYGPGFTSAPHICFLTPTGFSWILVILEVEWVRRSSSEELLLNQAFTSFIFQVIISYPIPVYHISTKRRDFLFVPTELDTCLFHTLFPVHLAEGRSKNFLQSLHQIQRTWLRQNMLFLQMTCSLILKNSHDKNSFISLGIEQINSTCNLASSLPALWVLPVTLSSQQLFGGCCLCCSSHWGYHTTLPWIGCNRLRFSLFLRCRFFRSLCILQLFLNQLFLILN